MKRWFSLLVTLLVLSVIIHADEKFYKKENPFITDVDSLALMPTENNIWQSLEEQYNLPTGWFFGLKRLESDGVYKKTNYQSLSEPGFVDSIAAVTDSMIRYCFNEANKSYILPDGEIRSLCKRILVNLNAADERNPFTTLNHNFPKGKFIHLLLDSLGADAVLVPSYQLASAEISRSIAKWDGYSERYSTSAGYEVEGKTYAFSMVSTMIGRDGDTLWVGRYGMRVLNARTNGENIFEKDRIEEAVRKSFKKVLKK